MPPKVNNESSGTMKQKSLMAFFGKGKAAPEAPQPKEVFRTPESKKVATPYSASSSAGSIRETPPTSDAIAVDIDCDKGDHEEVTFKVSPTPSNGEWLVLIL
jgi:hypothetical protein